MHTQLTTFGPNNSKQDRNWSASCSLTASEQIHPRNINYLSLISLPHAAIAAAFCRLAFYNYRRVVNEVHTAYVPLPERVFLCKRYEHCVSTFYFRAALNFWHSTRKLSGTQTFMTSSVGRMSLTHLRRYRYSYLARRSWSLLVLAIGRLQR